MSSHPFVVESENLSPPEEHCSFEYTAFASDLQIPPGKWPTIIRVKGFIGNGGDFVMSHLENVWPPRFEGVVYTQALGITTIRIFND